MFKIFVFTFLLCLNVHAIEKVPTEIANSYRLISVEKTLIGVAKYDVFSRK